MYNDHGDAMGTVNVTFRIDENLKKDADKLFSELGLNMSTAFSVFLHQAVREQGVPFHITKNVPAVTGTDNKEKS